LALAARRRLALVLKASFSMLINEVRRDDSWR
jgi:hypothetical protein